MPQRIQRRRVKGWRAPEGSVYVGRPSKWGNPSDWRDMPKWPPMYGPDGEMNEDPHRIPDSARRRWAVSCFISIARYRIGAGDYPTIAEIRQELAGKDLLCWCPESEPCHADELLRLANSEACNCGQPVAEDDYLCDSCRNEFDHQLEAFGSRT